MDKNEDGKVSEAEFVRAIMGHEKMASKLALKIVQVFDPDVWNKRTHTYFCTPIHYSIEAKRVTN